MTVCEINLLIQHDWIMRPRSRTECDQDRRADLERKRWCAGGLEQWRKAHSIKVKP